MTTLITRLYALMDKSPLRALSLIMALALAGCVFWNPASFAARTSELEVWHGFVLIWAVCAGVIHGTGFRLRTPRWQALFCPLVANLILLAGLLFYFR